GRSSRDQSGSASASSTSEAPIAKTFASRLRFFGKKRRRAAAALGRKTRTVRIRVCRSAVMPSSGQHDQEERHDPEQKGERVVSDVAGLEKPQSVAHELDHERAGVQEAVDDEDVDDLPEHACE